MNETVREWITKADRDLATAGRESKALEDPNYDAVCFHAQQSAEKLIKALLIHLGTTPPRLHDLAYLAQLLQQLRPDWRWPLEDLRFLSRAAVEFRYPGESADRDDAVRALLVASQLRETILPLFDTAG